MLMIFTWTCILLTNAMLVFMLLRLRQHRREWLELEVAYQLLLQNHEALMPIHQMLQEAMQHTEPGESSCVTIELQHLQKAPDSPPTTSTPSRRLH